MLLEITTWDNTPILLNADQIKMIEPRWGVNPNNQTASFKDPSNPPFLQIGSVIHTSLSNEPIKTRTKPADLYHRLKDITIVC